MAKRVWSYNVTLSGLSFNETERDIMFDAYTDAISRKISELDNMIAESGDESCVVDSKSYSVREMKNTLESFNEGIHESFENNRDSFSLDSIVSPGEIRFDTMKDVFYLLSDVDENIRMDSIVISCLPESTVSLCKRDNIDYYNTIEMQFSNKGCKQRVSHTEQDGDVFIPADLVLMFKDDECKDDMAQIANELRLHINRQNSMSNEDVIEENNRTREEYSQLSL